MLKNNAIHPWEQRKLGETLSLLKDGTHGTHKNVDDGYYLLSAKNIKNGKVLMFDDDRKISKDEYSLIHRTFVLKDKDVLITIVGSIGQSALYRLKEPVTFQRSVAYLRPKLFSSEYLYWIINTPMFKKKLQASQTLSAQPGIYLSDLSSITINYTTNFKEENKIVQLLNFINKTIELHQRKLETLISINTLINHILLPQNKFINPQIRITNFKENWVQRKASELCTISTGKSNTQDRAESGMYPFFIRSESPVRSNKYLYDCEAIITIGDGKIGKVFHYINGKFDLHQRCYMMNNFQNILGKYFYYYFSNNFHRRALTMTAKATVDSVRLEMIADMGIKFPINIEEQKRIIDILDSISKLIYLQKKKIKQYQFLKTYYLKSLFI